MWFLYLLMVLIAVVSIILSVIVRKKIAAIENEQERKLVKARWQLIFGLLGMSAIIVAGILVFTMF